MELIVLNVTKYFIMLMRAIGLKISECWILYILHWRSLTSMAWWRNGKAPLPPPLPPRLPTIWHSTQRLSSAFSNTFSSLVYSILFWYLDMNNLLLFYHSKIFISKTFLYLTFNIFFRSNLFNGKVKDKQTYIRIVLYWRIVLYKLFATAGFMKMVQCTLF